MSIELQLDPELETRLRQQAAAAGQDVDRYLADMLGDQLLDVDVDVPAKTTLSTEDWEEHLVAWADGFPSVSHFVDDSRESIYGDRH